MRSAEVRSTRLSQLAQALTEELIHQEEWFPISLEPEHTYEVSQVDSPILEFGFPHRPDAQPGPESRADERAAVTRLGVQLSSSPGRFSAVLTEESG